MVLFHLCYAIYAIINNGAHLSLPFISTMLYSSVSCRGRLRGYFNARPLTWLLFRCLSTVYVAAESKNGLVYYRSDSDAMITKGMARLLSVGLSGNTAEAIQKVKPEFIRVAGLQASLTAGFVSHTAPIDGRSMCE